MNSEVAWVLVSSGIQVQPQIILDPDYLSDYLSVSCDYAFTVHVFTWMLPSDHEVYYSYKTHVKNIVRPNRVSSKYVSCVSTTRKPS